MNMNIIVYNIFNIGIHINMMNNSVHFILERTENVFVYYMLIKQ